MARLPADSRPDDSGGSAGNGAGQSVNIQNFHYENNDIDALKRMADDHPELADKLVDNRMREVAIMANSECLGMFMATILGISLVGGMSWTLVSLGWWQSLMFVAALRGISHILRTLLKGEFSDTSWFGRILTRTPAGPEDDS